MDETVERRTGPHCTSSSSSASPVVVVVWVAPEAPPTTPLMLAPDADDGGRECLRDEDEPQYPVVRFLD